MAAQIELFINPPATNATMTSGGTTAPAQLTSQTWTMAGGYASFPASNSGATPPTFFRFYDIAAPTEIMWCTNGGNTTSWTVIRGEEGTATVAHLANCVVQTVSSGGTFSNCVQNGGVNGGILLPNTGNPAAVTGAVPITADAAGYPRYISGLAGDTDVYLMGYKVARSTSTTSIVATTPGTAITGLSLNVGIGAYMIRGKVRGANAASGTLQPNGIEFGGSCAVSSMGVTIIQSQEAISSTSAVGFLSSLAAGASFVRTPGLSELWVMEFDGFMTVSTAGTFLVNGYLGTSSSDVTWTAQSNAYLALWPWT